MADLRQYFVDISLKNRALEAMHSKELKEGYTVVIMIILTDKYWEGEGVATI